MNQEMSFSRQMMAMMMAMTANATAWIVLSLPPCYEMPLAQPVSQDERPQEATSFLGEPLRRLPLQADRLEELEQEIKRLQGEIERQPEDPEHWIWLGRRLAYAGRYREAIATFTGGLERFPGHAALLRHRGHRWITLRQLDQAITDLEAAAAAIRGVPDEIEPDGIPNALGRPTSTLHTNVYYHLGLAYYLRGDFKRAREAYNQCLVACTTDDMRVAVVHWLYMAMRRLGDDLAAGELLEQIGPEVSIIENDAYLRLIRLYQGKLAPDDLVVDQSSPMSDVDLATYGYGLGNWFLVEGEVQRAMEWWRRVIGGSQWAAFGHIAAEAELARRKE